MFELYPVIQLVFLVAYVPTEIGGTIVQGVLAYSQNAKNLQMKLDSEATTWQQLRRNGRYGPDVNQQIFVESTLLKRVALRDKEQSRNYAPVKVTEEPAFGF